MPTIDVIGRFSFWPAIPIQKESLKWIRQDEQNSLFHLFFTPGLVKNHKWLTKLMY